MGSARTYYIYVLIDPRNAAIRYLGVSVQPHTRLQQHISCATSERRDSQPSTGQWIRELAGTGLSPEMKIVEQFEADSNDLRVSIEGEWIWHLRDTGAQLLNRYPSTRRWYHHGKSEVLKTHHINIEKLSIRVLTNKP